jgi:hypothetical protein
MKVSNIKQLSKLDPEDIREASGDAQRELKRKKLIKSFLWWSTGEKDRWNKQNNEERIIVKRQYAYARLLTGFGLFTNFAIYNCFLTGIYNFRTTELLDMRRVPFLLKFAISTASAFYFCNKLWDSNIYEADLYQVALKYREKYDKDYMRPVVLPSAAGVYDSA